MPYTQPLAIPHCPLAADPHQASMSALLVARIHRRRRNSVQGILDFRALLYRFKLLILRAERDQLMLDLGHLLHNKSHTLTELIKIILDKNIL